MEASVASAHIPESGILSMMFTTEDGENWHVDPSSYFFNTPHDDYIVVYRRSDVKKFPKFANDVKDLIHYPQASAPSMGDIAYATLANGESCYIKLIADYTLYEYCNRNTQATTNFMVSVIIQLTELLILPGGAYMKHAGSEII